ncbi:PepSY domain-containing protein [Streptomyces sp. NBC_01433]|uniref:PepSY domain-containing protein n=1 Tax=Streptomyces sp. NBC_01433 TaxID=2903864 RepID=UPI0022589849|nr:PepSY domain-containing protein [Streptomyces sp. NBC_01433]MCX4680964.1 PepSY domain-containing protein [Streptomyces sp. NBC_01433]
MIRVSPRARNLRVAGALCVVAAAVLVTGCGASGDETTATATSEAAKVVPQQTTSASKSASGSPSATAQLTKDQKERKRLIEATKVTFDKAAKTAVGEVAGSKLAELDLDDGDSAASASPSGTKSPSGSTRPSGSKSASPSGAMSSSSMSSGSPSTGAVKPEWVAEVVEKDGTAHTVRIDAVSGEVIEAKADTDQDAAEKKQMAQWITEATQTPEQAAKVATDKKKGTVTSVNLDDNNGKGVMWAVDVVDADWMKTTFDVDAKTDTIIREKTDNN